MNSLGRIISENRKKQKMTQPQLAERLAEKGIQISHKTISGWEKGLSEPSVYTFAELCRILKVPDLYVALFGSNPFDAASELNDEGREKLREYASLLLATHKFDRLPAEVLPFQARRIKLFDVRVSAGTGNFLDGDSFEWLEAGPEVPTDADYGVRIAGDSMEPYIPDGAVALVRRSPIATGDVGLFFVDGDMKCKQYVRDAFGTVYLLSLNRARADADMKIPVDSEVTLCCFGKVLLDRRPPLMV